MSKAKTEARPQETILPVPVASSELQTERQGEGTQGEAECCLTAIRFQAVYPGKMTVTLTAADGRTVTRKFSAKGQSRTASIQKQDGGFDDDGETKTAIAGAMGPCVKVDVALQDTSKVPEVTVHYTFKVCCGDKTIHPGTVLADVPKPTAPGGQVSTLPLLKIQMVQRSPCPQA